MAAATATKGQTSMDALYLALAEGELPMSELLQVVPEKVVSMALNTGQIELGRTKHVITGNPGMPDLTHNGIPQAKAAVVIEDGIDWPLPNARITRYAPLSKILAETLPVAPTYQKYTLEVCVNKEKDIWEWISHPSQASDREVRWARRKIDRAEAEKCFVLYVRLTDKGFEMLRAE